jgi:alcohol dehydrogenase class IV
MSYIPIRRFTMPEVHYGPGSRALAGEQLARLRVTHALLVTDETVRAQPWMQEIEASLRAADMAVTVFSHVSPNPRDEEVREGTALYLKAECDGILAVGGGSPMDAAKCIGIMVANTRDILEFRGVDLVEKPLPPMVFVPSTAGTASEVSQFSIVLDMRERVKIAIVSNRVVPDVALVDPETTGTVDAALVAATGMDVLVHAMEAYVSTHHSAMTDLQALDAVRLVAACLPARIRNLQDVSARNGMMLASMEAGLAFSNAILGAVHAMAHSLGGLLDLPHGECNAILLPHVVDFNYDAEPERYDRIGLRLGVSADTPAADRKAALLAAIRNMQRVVGMDHGLAAVGVKHDDIPALARKAREDPCLLTNPKACTEEDLEGIFRAAMFV